MPLPPFLKRKADTAPASAMADEAAPVLEARVRARRRLIGAVVLLALGLVLFPWLFESKPRPLPLDISIEVARKDGSASPKAAAAAPRAVTVTPPPDAGNETPLAPPPAAQGAPAKADAATAEPPAATPEAATPVAAPAPVAQPASAAAAAVAASKGRFVVQVGAFNEATALREARSKVEKLGLKTYTQVIETASGARTRVRVGPFETRDEADRASVRLKAAGLPAYILVL
jgi:DedD protein